ncbi:hypothetical protein FM103_12065 [Corynebacterium xerosis]|nr:hypothetical protein FM103_12065 [Corynebacterium xerosis]
MDSAAIQDHRLVAVLGCQREIVQDYNDRQTTARQLVQH